MPGVIEAFLQGNFLHFLSATLWQMTGISLEALLYLNAIDFILTTAVIFNWRKRSGYRKRVNKI